MKTWIHGYSSPLLWWVELFLMNWIQRVNVGSTLTEWVEIRGTVPQEVICFICMKHDLETNSTTVKYVDVITIYDRTNSILGKSIQLQVPVDAVLQWWQANKMRINPTKSMDMMISFTKWKPDVSHIVFENVDFERVENCTLLSITLNTSLTRLTWHDHINKV